MKSSVLGLAAAALLVTLGSSAQAASYDVDLSEWESHGELYDPSNTSFQVYLGPGLQVTGFEYVDLSFESYEPSFQREFVLSVYNSDGSGYLDWSPSVVYDYGVFGPVTASWGGISGDAPDVVYENPEGAAFTTLADGMVNLTVYETFDDDGLDARISQGTLRIMYAVPEPSTYAMMALGLMAVGAAVRRRA